MAVFLDISSIQCPQKHGSTLGGCSKLAASARFGAGTGPTRKDPAPAVSMLHIYVHSFIHLSFTYLFIGLCVYSFMYLFVDSFMYLYDIRYMSIYIYTYYIHIHV